MGAMLDAGLRVESYPTLESAIELDQNENVTLSPCGHKITRTAALALFGPLTEHGCVRSSECPIPECRLTVVSYQDGDMKVEGDCSCCEDLGTTIEGIKKVFMEALTSCLGFGIPSHAASKDISQLGFRSVLDEGFPRDPVNSRR